MLFATSNLQKEDPLFFKATTTYNQVLALAIYMKRHHNSMEEINATIKSSRIKQSKTYDRPEVIKWLKNSWNTEKIMRVSNLILEDSENQYALQWSFPQAYYSIFSSITAFFKVVGFTETSHVAIIKKFGELCRTNKYPAHMNFYSTGHYKNVEICNINCDNLEKEFHLMMLKKESCESKICQLLKNTRTKQLYDLRNENSVRKLFQVNKKGIKTEKKSLTNDDWNKISEMRKETTLLNFLYRKRIKSNYQEVDTFTYEKIKSASIHKALISIVNELNLVHESFIYVALGADEYAKIISSFLDTKHCEFLEKRTDLIINNI